MAPLCSIDKFSAFVTPAAFQTISKYCNPAMLSRHKQFKNPTHAPRRRTLWVLCDHAKNHFLGMTGSGLPSQPRINRLFSWINRSVS
jgi:inhibitor of KinA sporulation pathway (predicted exonuclease)